MLEYLAANIDIAVGAGVGLGAAQILGVIFAFCLCHAIETDIHQYIK